MAKKYIPEGAFISCDKGTSPSTLRVSNNEKTTIYNKPMATEADMLPFLNLKPCGFCTSPIKIALSGIMCMPTVLQWDNPQDGVKINGNRMLKDDSTCKCVIGQGELKIFFDRNEAVKYSAGNGKMPTDYIKEGFDWIEENTKKGRAERDANSPDWMKSLNHVSDWFEDATTGLVEGVVDGVVGMGEGIYQMAQDPVGTAENIGHGLKWLAERDMQMKQWMADPQNWKDAASSTYDWASKGENWAKLKDDTIEGAKKTGTWIANNPRQIGKGTGEAGVFVASFFVGAGEAKVAAMAGEAGDAAKVLDVASDLGKAGKVGEIAATAGKAEDIAAVIVKSEEELLAVEKAAQEAKAVEEAAAKAKSGCSEGHPVDTITGDVFFSNTDFELPGPIPLKWRREYNSGSKYKGILGYGVASSYDLHLIENTKDNLIEIFQNDGSALAVIMPTEEHPSYHSVAQFEVYKHQSTYKVFDYKSRLWYIYKNVGGNYYKPALIEDERGFSIQFNYIGMKLINIIDSVGRILEVTSNVQGYIIKIELPTASENRVLVEYEYNEEGDMIAVSDSLHYKNTFEYDNHRIIKETLRNGQRFYWEYNNQGKCIHTWGDDGLFEFFIEYQNKKNIITSPQGKHEIIYYNEFYKPIQITDAFGHSKRFEYDKKGRLIKEIDEEGLKTTHKYDANGNLILTELPDGATYISKYDEENRLILRSDPLGNFNTWVYKNNKLTVSNNPLSSAVFLYNEHNLISEIKTDEGETLLEYDNCYNLIKMTLPDGRMTQWVYNTFGECTEIINPLGKKQQFEYDRLGRVKQIKLPTSEVIDMKYDAYDNVLKVNSLRTKVNYAYTPLGSIKSREENGVKITFDYDKQERLKALFNEQGDQYKFTRNRRGDIIQEVSFDGITKYYNRDRAGKVVKVKREGSRYTEYEYDKGGRITRADYHDGYWETFDYDKAGLLVKAKNPDNYVYFKRNKNGLVLQEIQGEHTIDYVYDEKQNLISLKSSLGADVIYERDRYGRIDSIKSGAGENEWVANIKRNMLGLEIERTLPGGMVSSWNYDAENNPVKQTVTRGNEQTLNRTYSWNANQQLHQITNGITSGITEFGYDTFSSLAWAQYEDGSKDYKMPDEIGNLFHTKDRKNRIYGKGGKLIKDENWYYSYDAEGNMRLKSKRNIVQTQLQNRQLQLNEGKPLKNSFFIEEIKEEKSQEKTLDYYLRTDIKFSKEDKEEYKRLKEGLRVQNEEWQQGDWLYTWQANGMLKSAKKPDGSEVSFEYDALGRRTAKIHKENVTRFIWDGNVLLHEWNYEQKKRQRLSLDDKGEFIVGEEKIENLITWVYEDGSFIPSAKIQDGKKYSVISDYIGRPAQAYDEKGEKVWETDYDIYGRLLNLHGKKQLIPFRQLGQYEDEELEGLYYNRFRYYDCNVGNYISQDPIGLEGNNPNFYAYVGDSNTLIDVFGLDPKPKTIKLRHYTSKSGMEGIQKDMEIKAYDQNKIFTERAKGKRLSAADAAEKYGIKKGSARATVEFEVDASRVEIVENPVTKATEHVVKGNIKLDTETTKFNCG